MHYAQNSFESWAQQTVDNIASVPFFFNEKRTTSEHS